MDNLSMQSTEKHPLNDVYQQVIFKTRYAKYLPEENRRETWRETVSRYISFMQDHLQENLDYNIPIDLYTALYNAIYNLEIMPSMRALMTAGKALKRDHIAGFNCSYIPINTISAFSDMTYILMCGTGVGFSVERQEINKLPEIPKNLINAKDIQIVEDSKQGWADSVKTLVTSLYEGTIVSFDYSKLRPKGAPLKTFGGRSSGGESLVTLHTFITQTFMKAKGRKLESLELHDICCNIGQCIVSGGVRRSALLSLSNLSDQRMRDAKSGEFYKTTPYRTIANNSVAYTEKPSMQQFMQEWHSLYMSKAGERGIFNREACKQQVQNSNLDRDPNHNFGTNPCGEIILRPFEFCNLSEVIVRQDDTKKTLKEKVKLATILGTYQSSLTNFKVINKKFQENCEEERLLGVSLTGIMDSDLLQQDKSLAKTLKEVAEITNKETSSEIGIQPSKGITCIKPSGTVSQLCNTSSGIHSRFANKYIRTIRNSKDDPISKFLIESGIKYEEDCISPSNYVFYFPINTNQKTIKELSAIDSLENWLHFKNNYCHHNPSVTIYVDEDEWLEVGAWVYKHFDEAAGLTFLPKSDHIYQQAPYILCNDEEFDDLVKRTPTHIDWSTFKEYQDNTTNSQELACVGGSCEL